MSSTDNQTGGNTETPKAKAPKTVKPRAPRAPKVTKAGKAQTVSTKAICDQFEKQVREKYELDDTVISEICDVVSLVLTKYFIYSEQQQLVVASDTESVAESLAESSVGDAKDKKPKKPRKTTAYNVYVKEMMQDEKVKAVEQKAKMTVIGNMWKALTPEQKAPYQVRANSADETATQV